jgi:hypothetical protein
MKKYFYLLGILSLTVSCGTATYMYDDVYDVAEGKSLTEEGYTDLIKDNEKDHKVVVDKKDRVTFGGYYPSNNTSTGGTSFSSNNNCNCSCGHYSSANKWRYVQPGWTYGNPNSLWFNSCSCNHWNNNLAYHYTSFGNMYNLYGYYDYWGGWNSYYPIGMDPYGYYASVYGWYPYQWYNNNNNGIFSGNNIVNGNPSGGTNTNDGGNHFYGHRNPSSTSSSNTTVYAHTVKEDYEKPVSSTSLQSTTNTITNPFQTNGSSGITNKPLIQHEETVISSNPFGTSVISEPTTVNQSIKPVSNNTETATNTSTSVATQTGNTMGTTTTEISSKPNHVAASNQFEVKYPTVTVSRTGSGQTTGTQQVDPVNQNTGPTKYYTPPVVTNTTSTTTTNSSSRSTNTTYNSTTTNTNSSNSNTYSGSNSTTSHRSSTSTTNSGSGSTTNSGGSRTTTTSRR